MIPREAVEAAAKAAYEFRYRGRAWEDLAPLAQCDLESEMRLAIHAALTYIQEARA